MTKRLKTTNQGKEGSCGIRLENINPKLPADNEHSHAGTIALARAVVELAQAIAAAAKALEETARHTQKAGVFIGNCHVSAG